MTGDPPLGKPGAGTTSSLRGNSLSNAPQIAERRALESAIGRQLRVIRQQNNLTVTELARQTGLSPSLLSRIENGNSAPSLSSLQAIAQSLNVPISRFFHDFESSWEVSHVKAGAGSLVQRRGTKSGHQYRLLGHRLGQTSDHDVVVEPFLITMTEEAKPFPLFQHTGTEFLHILTGQILYRHGDKSFLLKRGDSLYFDATAPHGPQELRKLPLRFLSVIVYKHEPR